MCYCQNVDIGSYADAVFRRNNGFYRRLMAEAALGMRDVMSQEKEPSFVIRDPIYVKESTKCTSMLHIFNGRWLVGLEETAIGLVFGQLIWN